MPRKLLTYKAFEGCSVGLGSCWMKPCFIKRADIQ